MIKRTKKERDQEANQIVAEISQNRTAAKDQFCRKSSVAQIEKCKTNESLVITWGMCTRNRRSK
jgi:hypothetical protein